MLACAVFAVLVFFAAEAFISYLEVRRTEQIAANIEQGFWTPISDPTWAVLVQIGIVFLGAFALVKFSLSIFYLISRRRVYMQVDGDGITYYKFKFSVRKSPHVEEILIRWSAFYDISAKKGSFFNEIIALSKTEMSTDDPKRTFEIPIKYAEDKAEDIISAINTCKLKT